MTVKTPHGDFEIRELSFKDRRELHRLEVKSFKDGELDIEKYYDVLEWVMAFAFKDPEKSLGKLDDNAIDEILSAVYSEYKGMNKKK
tara:strand:- start:467 stop:727 length:261 start_codon:yes stop_codon:yes gene_type:complete